MAKVALIGCGLIGRSWAIVFARGAGTSSFTTSAPTGWRRRRQDCCQPARIGRAGAVAEPEATIARIGVAKSLEAAVEGSEFVQESLPELVAEKRAIFRDLDRLVPPPVVLASSTSAIVVSQFAADLPGRSRCLVGHPVNPPHLVPLVEVVGASFTSPAAIDRAQAVYDEIGQVPIRVRRELDGFILNRLQGALLAEAFRLVEEGYVSPQDLDKTLKDGLGLRWCFMGPFETIELNAPGGIRDYCRRYGEGYARRQADPAPAEVFAASGIDRIMAAWGNPPTPEALEARARWRDRRLAALRAHKQSQPEP